MLLPLYRVLVVDTYEIRVDGILFSVHIQLQGLKRHFEFLERRLLLYLTEYDTHLSEKLLQKSLSLRN